MSGDRPNDHPPPRMPWEPEPPAPGPPPPEPPAPGTGWTPPSPTDPTTVWSPAPPAQPLAPPGSEPATTAPQPPPGGQGALLSSTTVGWAAPPPAAVEVAPGLTFADTWTRVIAYIVDSILLVIIVSIVVASLGVSADITEADAMAGLNSPAGSLGTALLGFLYFVGFWTGGRRATIGQRIFSIQVGNAFDGKALSLEQAVRRWLGLGSWISLFGVVPSLVGVSQLIALLWAIILLITTATSPTKQGIHDRFANSALVSPAGQGTSGLAKACLVIVGVLFLLFVGTVLALILLGTQLSTILSEIGDSI